MEFIVLQEEETIARYIKGVVGYPTKVWKKGIYTPSTFFVLGRIDEPRDVEMSIDRSRLCTSSVGLSSYHKQVLATHVTEATNSGKPS